MPPAPSPRPAGLVVVVGSAGGVEALKRFVGALPAGLPATVLVALHLPASIRSYLHEVLARCSRLPVRPATDGQALVPGEVVVARPDTHLLVVGDEVVLGTGRVESGYRPSHDAMLRAAALARGPAVVAVVLTGLLDDGADGLAVVDRYGGRCLVQDPAEAEFPSMPLAALRAVPRAKALPLEELVQEVVRIVDDDVRPAPEVPAEQRARDEAERDSARGSGPGPSASGCAEDAVTGLGDDVTKALRTALQVLEERAELSRRLASDAGDAHREWSSEHYLKRAEEAEASAALLRSVLRREATGTPPAPPPPLP
jgi:two-component system chemotaxis response regulator CheB